MTKVIVLGCAHGFGGVFEWKNFERFRVEGFNPFLVKKTFKSHLSSTNVIVGLVIHYWLALYKQLQVLYHFLQYFT